MGQNIRVVHHSQVEKSVLGHFECIGKYCGKQKFFKILTDEVQTCLLGE